MFRICADQTIHVTRGDIVFFDVTANTQDGAPYTFKAGNVLRLRVFEKKNCENVVLRKDFKLDVDADRVEIYLTEANTKFGLTSLEMIPAM